jgi:hypothetical protein
VSDSTEPAWARSKRPPSLVNQLRADEVIIIHFDGVLNVVGQPSSDRAVLRAMIEHVPSGSGTHLYDAVDKVLTRLTQIKGRKAVVLFTDGVDVGSQTTAKQTLREAEAGEALIYSVYYDTQEARERNCPLTSLIRFLSRAELLNSVYAVARRYLDSLAKGTGARMYPASNPEKWPSRLLQSPKDSGPIQSGHIRRTPRMASGADQDPDQTQGEVDARDSYLCRAPIGSKK